MNPWAAFIWLLVLIVVVAVWSIMLENAYWTWFRPWQARRRWERDRRKRGTW